MLFPRSLLHVVPALIALAACARLAAATAPVNPLAFQASHDLLAYLEGQRAAGLILSGQQNKTVWGDRVGEDSAHVHALTQPQVYPALYGFDLGSNSRLLTENRIPIATARADMIAGAIAWWRRGALLTVSWHQTSPKDAHPDLGGFPSAQAHAAMSDAEFHEIVTPGTTLHARWLAHVDLIAPYLLKLRDAGVPVLWRPYHEMNGDWFWWCARPAADYRQLWHNLYERLVRHHGLNNLVWVWSPSMAPTDFRGFYPGSAEVDITGVDIYQADRAALDYTRLAAALTALAPDKAFALTECGLFPTSEAIAHVPYLWFLSWHGVHLDRDWDLPGYPSKPALTEGNTAATVREFYASPRTLTLDEVNLPRSYEAELLSAQPGSTAARIAESAASATNGQITRIHFAQAGDHATFILPVPKPGIYRLSARVRSSGDISLKVAIHAGTPHTVALSASETGFHTVVLGRAICTAGDSPTVQLSLQSLQACDVAVDSWTLTLESSGSVPL